MKRISFILAFFVSLNSFAQLEQTVRDAFTKSIAGFDKMVTANSGSSWQYPSALNEFQHAEIRYDLIKKIHVLTMYNVVANEETAIDLANRWIPRIESAIPKNYTRSVVSSNEYGATHHRFVHPSGMNEYPVVDIQTVNVGGTYQLQVVIYEPAVKNAYVPVFE